MLLEQLKAFLSGQVKNADAYGLLATRLVVAAFWVNAVVPRWVALAAGRPVSHPLVVILFGSSMSIPLTYFFTILETLGAIALVLGLATRLACVWGVAQFIITGAYGVITGSLLLSKDLGLLAGCFRLLLTGSTMYSLDRYLLKRKAPSRPK